MTVGLRDAVILADLLGSTCLYDENAVDEALGQVHLLRQSSANVNILADALYGLFSAQDPATLLLQQACFRYFQRGGTCVSTPVRLLAGLESSVWLLVYHFIWVAIGAVALALHQYNLVLAVQVVICAVQVGLPHLLSQYQY